MVVHAGYFDAPGTKQAALGAAWGQGIKAELPLVTLVFSAVDGLRAMRVSPQFCCLTKSCDKHVAAPCGKHVTAPCGKHLTGPFGKHVTAPCGKHVTAPCAFFGNSLFNCGWHVLCC